MQIIRLPQDQQIRFVERVRTRAKRLLARVSDMRPTVLDRRVEGYGLIAVPGL